MSIHEFSPSVAQLVRRHLDSGHYASEEDVLLAALNTLETESRDQSAIAQALATLDAGDEGISLRDAFDEVRKRHHVILSS